MTLSSMAADQKFWGHVDVRFPGTGIALGGPITAATAHSFRQRLTADHGAPSAWATVETLSNRFLMLRLDEVRDVFLIDDASDWSLDNRSWETALDDYAGIPLDTYRSMAMWADGDCSEWMVSASARRHALSLIEQSRFLDRRQELTTLLQHTVFHFLDGTSASFHANRQDLAELVETVEVGEIGIVPFRQRDDEFERYINLQTIRAIDVSMIELLAAYEEMAAEK